MSTSSQELHIDEESQSKKIRPVKTWIKPEQGEYIRVELKGKDTLHRC